MTMLQLGQGDDWAQVTVLPVEQTIEEDARARETIEQALRQSPR
jgi:hypothetical protein